MIASKQEPPLPNLEDFFKKYNCTYEEQRQLRALLLALRLGQIDIPMLTMIINKYKDIL